MKDKNNVAIATGSENIFNKTQHPFTIKLLKQLCVEKNVLQHNKGCMCAPSHCSRMQLFATLWIVAHQAPLSTGFFRQEYWSGLPCPPPGNLSNSGIEPASLTSPALAGRFFITKATWEVQ